MKRIEVLMAAYEGERWLRGQLRSLREQEDACFSVLMQDDGSTDHTQTLLADAAAADDRFRLAAAQGEHFGAIGNFWSLLKQSDAPYCALCDQDDLWEPNRLSRCREAMEQAELRWGEHTPILVHSDCRVTNAEGETLQESFFAHQGWDASAVGLNRLLVQNNVTGCTCLMNAPLRALAVRCGDPSRMVMHDWFLALTAAAFGHIVFIPEPLVNYRQHGSNVQGASQQGLAARGLRAMGAWQKGRGRIALTYRHTADFRAAYGDLLPEDAASIIDGYLRTEKMSKLHRVVAVRRMGCTMQSTVTRMGQIVFG